jgi:4-hydroxybutyryl-CoA dehydratase/vinylacetyl-CoA-Delta-isomerase
MASTDSESADIQQIRTGAQYIESLRGRDLTVYLFGERVLEPVDHPVIRPSINAVAETYDLAERDPQLGTALSPYTGERINRFLHIATSPEDLVMQNKMQRRMGQLTGTCFQRCVGMDAFNSLHSVTYEIDEANQTSYHARFVDFVTQAQRAGSVIGGAMTDVKGDRSKAPHEQDDPDMFVRVVKRSEDGVWIRGAQGASNRMREFTLDARDADLASGAGRQGFCDRGRHPGRCRRHHLYLRAAKFAGQEAMVIFDDVFIPNNLIFMDGEFDFAAMLVERFTCYHRRSYVCKSGVGDVLIGAAATIADYNGVDRASHIRDKLVEMTHLNETIYSTGIASSYQATETKSGVFINDDMIANVCKHHVTKMPYEIGRLAQDLAGGLMVTAPSEKELDHPEIGDIVRKYLKGRKEIDAVDRVRILRLIENMTMGRNAVGYLTESLHGAGSPQAQRIQIGRQMQLDFKKQLAKTLAGIAPESTEEVSADLAGYMAQVFASVAGDAE